MNATEPALAGPATSADTVTLEWVDVRIAAITKFRDELPHAETEQTIIELFEQMPNVVLRAIDDVAAQVATGKVRNGWAVLRKRLCDAEPAGNVTVNVSTNREAKVRWAEAWIKHAGLFFDRESELVDELFGYSGRLRAYAADDLLKQRLVAHWRKHRPRGEQTEQEAEERARKHLALRSEAA